MNILIPFKDHLNDHHDNTATKAAASTYKNSVNVSLTTSEMPKHQVFQPILSNRSSRVKVLIPPMTPASNDEPKKDEDIPESRNRSIEDDSVVISTPLGKYQTEDLISQIERDLKKSYLVTKQKLLLDLKGSSSRLQ